MRSKEIKMDELQLSENEKDKVLFSHFSILEEPADSEKKIEFHDIPRQVKSGGIFICRRGEAEFFLDLKNYKLRKGDMCVVFPFSILQLICKSDDFEGSGGIAGIELFENIQIPSSMDYYLYIKDNPCISISDEEQNMLIEIRDKMMQKQACQEHPFHMEITYSLFRILYYEIAAIYKKGKPIAQESVSRKDMLVRRFLFLLAKNYQKNRAVDYYARELCVTPRYLSSVVKTRTGIGALYWINDMVVRQAKALLKDRRLSVLQISDELNFPNPSFFGQYFKKYTGMTPKKFRDREV